MLNTKSFLAVDFGAGTLKIAKFEAGEAGALVLKHYALKPLGQAGAIESKREEVVLKAIQEALPEFGADAKNVNICAPGFHVFSKFVKLPPVDSGKVTQIIQYEAQQNVPFPLAEVVWDYQILGSTAAGELEVLLVAIKSDIVERLFRMTDSAKLSLQLTDVSPAALCNAFRYSYGDLEGCTMLLDIGAKTSNLLFFEKGKVYARSINLGANSITQDFASEVKQPFDAAEQIKIDEGFVSLGGAYEEPENPNQAAISKIARQFMTRLHIQVNQTLQFYRGQQGGSAPDRLFLCGGASVMPYTAQFFAEKLGIPVEYFNSFRNVQIDPEVDLEALSKVAHVLGEVVGLGLRNMAHCPVELNLMPESTLRWQSFSQKKPYFVATIVALVLTVAAVGWLFGRSATVKQDELAKVEGDTSPLKTKEQQFQRAYQDLEDAQAQLEEIERLTGARYHWADIFAELRRVLILVEEAGKRKFGVEVGLWIEEFTSLEQGPSVAGVFGASGTRGAYGSPGAGAMGAAAGRYGAGDRNPAADRYGAGNSYGAGNRYPEVDGLPGGDPYAEADRYGEDPVEFDGMNAGYEDSMGTGEPVAFDPVTGEPIVGGGEAASGPRIYVLCRAVSLTEINASGNTDIAFAFERLLRDSDMFDSSGTALEGQIGNDEENGTFTFGVNLVLKEPLVLEQPSEF